MCVATLAPLSGSETRLTRNSGSPINLSRCLATRSRILGTLAGRLGRRGRVVYQQQLQIIRIIQLLAAESAEGNDADPRLPASRLARLTLRLTTGGGQRSQGCFDERLGQGRELLADQLDLVPQEHVAIGNPQPFAVVDPREGCRD